MTIYGIFSKIWQFAKIVKFKYYNFRMTVILKIFKIWQSAIWQFFFNFQKYDNSHFSCIFEMLGFISHFPFSKISAFGNCHIWNMTIWIWQYFWKILKYDNYFKVDKIWQFAIWQLIRKNCHISISKYDNKKKPMIHGGAADTASAAGATAAADAKTPRL